MAEERIECRGRRVHFISEVVELPNNRKLRIDRVVFPNSVTILPLYEDECRIKLIEQYRPTIGDWLLEAPAGVIDENEGPLEAAMRELEEETGLKASRLVKLGEGYTSPGYSTEYMHIYLALNPAEGTQKPEEHEVIKNIVELKLEDAIKKILNGNIKDIKTILSIYGAYHYCSNK